MFQHENIFFMEGYKFIAMFHGCANVSLGISQTAVYFKNYEAEHSRNIVKRVTGPVGCTAAAGMRGGIIIPGIIGGIMPGI